MQEPSTITIKNRPRLPKIDTSPEHRDYHIRVSDSSATLPKNIIRPHRKSNTMIKPQLNLEAFEISKTPVVKSIKKPKSFVQSADASPSKIFSHSPSGITNDIFVLRPNKNLLDKNTLGNPNILHVRKKSHNLETFSDVSANIKSRLSKISEVSLKEKLVPLKKNFINSDSVFFNNESKFLCGNRAEYEVLKKAFTKNTNSVSILDFWTDDMKISASKMIPKVIKRNPSVGNIHSTFNHPETKTSKIEKPDMKNFVNGISSIIQVCDETSTETQALKIKLNNSFTKLIKLRK